VDEKGSKRLHHVVGVNGIEKNKNSIIIVDESDAIIMKDPILFA